MTAGIANERTWQLLNLLADGEFHSGEILADQMGVSRASIFNALEKVADSGVVLQRVRGRGYRLARPWHRLECSEILRQLGKDAAQFNLEILPQAASSNTLLLQRAGLDVANGGAPSGSVLAVELQTAGRGRMGRNWHSSVGTALTFSLLWKFDCGLNALSGLSLAVGVAVMRALKKLGVQDAQLKWPNDILTGQGKLAGVLIEAQGDMLGPSTVVIGIGLNYTMPANLERQIDQPASALEEVCAAMPTRNQLLAVMLLELAQVLRQFAQEGFAALRSEWEQCHIHQGRPVQMLLADGQVVSGIARGVSDSGELCLETGQGIRRFNSGEVAGKLRGLQRKLLIDAGNTRIKWALVDCMTQFAQASDANGNKWLRSGVLPVGQASELPGLFAATQDITQIWMSNVAGERVAHYVREIGAGRSVQFHSIVAQKLQCGVRNGYSNTAQLGSDRWAALIAAWHLVQKKCLVVSCGTAITIDTLSEQGEFLGGLIMPGVELMQHSLIGATDQLKSGQVKPEQGKYVPFPLNTADALLSGAIQAGCGAIQRQYALLEDNGAPVVLSGGAADILKENINLPLRVVDNLVLQGLLLISQESNAR